jgi:hypothetical protein
MLAPSKGEGLSSIFIPLTVGETPHRKDTQLESVRPPNVSDGYLLIWVHLGRMALQTAVQIIRALLATFLNVCARDWALKFNKTQKESCEFGIRA